MKIDNDTLIKSILGLGITIVGFKTIDEFTEIHLNIRMIIIIVAIAFAFYIATIAVRDYLKNLKTKNKNKVTEALSLLCYKDFFPLDIAQTIEKYFSDDSSNIALAAFSVNGKIFEYYWAVSNTKIDKKFGEKIYKTNDNLGDNSEIPIIFCKDKHSKVEFIIRGSKGELIPLSSSDIKLIEKIKSYSITYYTCSERKLIGELFSRHSDMIKSSPENVYEFIIFTKRPPCKYCNDLIEYYRNLYHPHISFFVFDNLLLNLVNNNELSHITFHNLDDAVNAVIEFEEKRKKINLKNRENERNNQLLSSKMKNYKITLEGYERIIKTLIRKLKHNENSPPKKEDIKKICCITERQKVGITDEEFEKTWEDK